MKKAIPKAPLVYPLPIALLGVEHETKVYYTTVSNLSVMGEMPPIIGVMIDKKRAIMKQLDVGSMISINYPDTTMIDKADLCATVSGETFDKASLFTTDYLLETPYIDECPVVLIAHIIDIVSIKRQRVFVCEVRRTLIEDTLAVDRNIPSMNILDPIIYGRDGKYYKIGSVIGKTSLEGRTLYQDIKKHMAPKPYSFHCKLKICQEKDAGKSYRKLAKAYDVYHETIEDWYALYTMFGREGLTKAFAHKLAKTQFTKAEKADIVRRIRSGELTYRDACQRYMVSLSRLRNWMKKTR